MPELRKDPVTDRWVIIATDRVAAPRRLCPRNGPHHALRAASALSAPATKAKRRPRCWPIGRGPAPNQPGWSLRVVPNKFPVLGIEGDLDREGEGLFDKMQGIGAHEVVIESPEHALSMTELPERSIEQVLWAFRDRVNDLKNDRRLRYVLLFKNHGEAAGATLEHTHSQLIALPVVPKRVQEELEVAKRYYDFKERCLFCDLIRQETKAGTRVVTETDQFRRARTLCAAVPVRDVDSAPAAQVAFRRQRMAQQLKILPGF